MPKFFLDLFDAVVTFAMGLVPGALGATIALAHEKGLTWRNRCIQFAAGTVVSYYAQGTLGALTDFDPFVLQAFGFSAGMVAFKSTPGFIAAASDAIVSVPGLIRDRIFGGSK